MSGTTCRDCGLSSFRLLSPQPQPHSQATNPTTTTRTSTVTKRRCTCCEVQHLQNTRTTPALILPRKELYLMLTSLDEIHSSAGAVLHPAAPGPLPRAPSRRPTPALLPMPLLCHPHQRLRRAHAY